MPIRNTDLIALEDRILVEGDAPEEVTKGGIILPDRSQEKPCLGVVIGVGPGKFENGQRTPMPVEAGDRVYYSKFGGQSLQVADQPLLLVLRPEHIIAKVPVEADDG